MVDSVNMCANVDSNIQTIHGMQHKLKSPKPFKTWVLIFARNDNINDLLFVNDGKEIAGRVDGTYFVYPVYYRYTGTL